MQYRNSTYGESSFDTYWFEKNLQGDIVAVYNENGTKLVSYTYDAWGNVTTTYHNGGASTAAQYNPFRYRGYYYDSELGFYYLNSRYYDPETGRFINADGEMSGVSGTVQGNNLFAYCFNNPVNFDDSNGNWPKWLKGVANIVSGALQTAAGVALGATVGWTGIGAAAAGLLIVNGAATISQGVGQVVNDITNSNYMREDNIVRTAVQDLGEAIGGDTGAMIATGMYDLSVLAASLYAGKVGLQQAGQLPVKVNINSLTPDPNNPMTDEGINYWTRTLSQNGFKGYNTLPNAYGNIEPIYVQKGTMMIVNGHHRVAVLARYGVKTIKVFFTK